MGYKVVDISLTSVQGYLMGAFAVATALLPSYPKQAGIAIVIIGALKAGVGAMQKDAGKTEAEVPGVPGTVTVPSHEVPDNDAAKPVVK